MHTILKKVTKSLALSALLLIAGGDLLAQAPRSFSYQGLLLDASRHPVAGLHGIVVNLYASPTGGAPIHSETFSSVVDNGVFSVVIGSQIPLGSAINFDKQYWLGVSVDGSPELPRTAITPVPYAMHSQTASALVPNAKGAVTSVNGKSGDILIKGGEGTVVTSDGNTFTITALQTVTATPQANGPAVVQSVVGTADQIKVNNDFVAHSGVITISAMQDIATNSDVTFGSATLGNLASSQPIRSNGSGKLVSGAIDLAGGTTEVSGILPVVNGGTNSGADLSGSSIMVATGGQIVQGQAGTTSTVLHGNASGVPSYGEVVNADMANPYTNFSSSDNSLTVPASINLGASGNFQINTAHANNWTGTQSFGATVNTPATAPMLTGNTDNFSIGISNTLYKISSTGNVTLSGLDATGSAEGRTVTLVNIGSSYITLSNQGTSSAGNQFSFAGNDDIIMGPNATATFMYVGANWILISDY